MTIERHDPLGGAFGAAMGVRAGDFVFTTVAGNEQLEQGEPVFGATFERQLEVVGEHLIARLQHFGCGLDAIVDATVWLHPSIDVTPGLLLDALQSQVFHGVVPALSCVRSPLLYPEELVGMKVVAYAPPKEPRDA